MQKSLWNIFKTFFKIGTLLLGGGYVILPLLQSEVANKKGWTTTDELVEFYAISQSLPGIIAANISIFVGYKLMKIPGAIAALAGVIAPAFLAIVLIANILTELVESKSVNNIFAGVAVGVVVLVILTIKEMWEKSVVDNFSKILFLAALIFACLKVSPVVIIIGSVIAGIVYRLLFPVCNKEENK